MADYYDFSDDVILPDDFNAAELDGTESTEETAPTIEQAPEDGNAGEQVVEAASTEETTVQPEVQDTTPAPEVAIPQTIRVKFNHEERELGLDEAAVYAQKGMNYDKLEERVRSFEANNAKTERLAKNLGYDSAEAMIKAAEENFINSQIRELVDAGNTEAMAKFLVEQRMEKASRAEQQESAPQEKPNPEVQGRPLIPPERKAELDEFAKAYPGVTKLPDEVFEANRNGVRLKTAYENYQLKQKYAEQTKQLNILKQNQAAAERAPVTGTVGKAAPKKEEPEDPFLKGFSSDDY